MDESKYRESRVCRLLGNPVVYQLVLFLESGGPLTPSKLAKIAGRSVQTVSGHFGKLRAADLVRYDTDGKQVQLLAEAQAGHEQASQSLGNHRAVLKQAYLRGHFDVSRILETWK
jgi:hypothetical protein